MRHLFIMILTLLTGICTAQSLSDSILDFGNEKILKSKVFENIYQFDVDPFSDGENPIFRDERDFKIKATLFSDEGKEIELPNDPDKYKLEIFAQSIKINPIINSIEISGYVSGGQYGAGSQVHIYIGQKIDTVINISLTPNLHGPTYYNGKKVKEPIVIATLPAFRLKNYFHQKSEVGYDDHKERAFKISGQFDKNSILLFGLSSSYVEIFEIGKILKEINNEVE